MTLQDAVAHLEGPAGAVVVAGRAGQRRRRDRHRAGRVAVREGDVLERELVHVRPVVRAVPVEDADGASAVDRHGAAAVDDGVRVGRAARWSAVTVMVAAAEPQSKVTTPPLVSAADSSRLRARRRGAGADDGRRVAHVGGRDGRRADGGRGRHSAAVHVGRRRARFPAPYVGRWRARLPAGRGRVPPTSILQPTRGARGPTPCAHRNQEGGGEDNRETDVAHGGIVTLTSLRRGRRLNETER